MTQHKLVILITSHHYHHLLPPWFGVKRLSIDSIQSRPIGQLDFSFQALSEGARGRELEPTEKPISVRMIVTDVCISQHSQSQQMQDGEI